jgi:hypothetical protein
VSPHGKNATFALSKKASREYFENNPPFVMKTLLAVFLGCALVGNVLAADSTERITPEIRGQIDAQKHTLAQWAKDPTLLAAVRSQNAKGPIPGLTNRKWRSLKPSDPTVVAFQQNPAGVLLARKAAASKGMFNELFLCAAQGEKVAFVEKPTTYLHKGEPKFDVPMSGKAWEGVPEYDKSSHSHAIQISTPVFDKGKPIGVLVAGVSMRVMKTGR